MIHKAKKVREGPQLMAEGGVTPEGLGHSYLYS
jgi:hypothetical protein